MTRVGPGFAIAAAAALAASVQAATIRVVADGTVAFNGIGTGPLAGIAPGSPATMSFTVDSTVFVNSAGFPVRGYAIDPASFSLTVGTVVVGLQSPLPAGETPYFVLRDNDPAVDGFYLSNTVDSPNGVPTNQSIPLGTLRAEYLVTYGGATLSSLDIAAAVGTYTFTGLTNFNWVLRVGPFEVFGIDFVQMTIALDTCYPDCNSSGTLTLADFGCFQGLYVLGHLYADCNAGGTLTVADFGCFQSKYVLGCP